MSSPEYQELRVQLRDERSPEDAVVVVRGGPTTPANLAAHAARTHAAFVLDGRPVWGVSVFCALDDAGPGSLDGLLQRFSSYPVVHLPLAGQLRARGFELLATFGRPHYTLSLSNGDAGEIARLIEALGAVVGNPYHGRKRPGRR